MSNNLTQRAFDVIVVGAGPVGLATALQLANSGWDVACVERWPSPYPLPRAITLDPEGMRVIQHLGLAEEMSRLGEPNDFYDWVNANGEVLLRLDNRAPEPPGWRALLFSQPALEALLERTAEEHPRVSILRGREVRDLRPGQHDVTVEMVFTESDEPAEPLTARYVVGCDGANSAVREKMGVNNSNLGYFFDWLVVDVIPQEERDWGATSYQICDPARPTTFVPGGPGRRRWEFMVLPGEDPAELSTPARVWELLAPWNLHEGNAELERAAVYSFQARWANSWNAGRLLIAGDAAHLVPPFAGQGLNSGLRDAENLSWKLDLVLRGDAPAALLDSYSGERIEHVQHAVHYSVALGRVICILDPEESARRDARMLGRDGDPAAVLPELPPAAFTSGVVATTHSVAGVAGTVAAQFPVRHRGRTALLDDFVPDLQASSRLQLLVNAEAADGVDASVRAALEDLGGRVIVFGSDEDDETFADVAGGYAQEFERTGTSALLVRPDGYYFGGCRSAAEVTDLVRDFERAIRG